MSYDTVLERLDERGLLSSIYGGEERPFRCPAHDDDAPSGSIREGDDGRALVTCYAGCDTRDIVDALGLEMRDLFGEPRVVAEYTYTDEAGAPLIRVQRYEPGFDGERKTFRQFHWDGEAWWPGAKGVRKVLYHLPLVLRSPRVYVVEGEKDADRLNQYLTPGAPVLPDEVATTGLGGAGKWLPEWTEALAGKDVVIIGDNDDAGRKHVRLVEDALGDAPASITVRYPAKGKDVSDHLDAGLDLDALVPGTRLRLKRLDLSNIPPARGLLYEPFVYERALTWLFGPSGHGKSMVMDKAMADLSRDGVPSLLYEWEEGYQEGERLQRLGANLELVSVFNMTDFEEPIDLGTEWLADEMIDAVRQTGARLVVVNPFILAGGGVTGSDPDAWNEAPRRARATFKRVIEDTGAAVVVIDHQDDPSAERAHGGRSKKWLSDIYLRVTRDGDEYQPGKPYFIRIDNLKQAREYLPTIRATVMGLHKKGPLWVTWDYTPAETSVGAPTLEPAQAEGSSGTEADAEAAGGEVPPAPPHLPFAERMALKRLKDELGATEVAE